jgi:integrase
VCHFEQMITPATVQAVTRKHALRFRTLRGAQVKGKSLSFKKSTLNYELEVMRAIFGYAMRDLQLIEVNPFSKIERLREKDSREMMILEDREIELCKEHFDKDPDFYPLFLFLVRTGVRIGEAHQVRRRDIDKVEGVVRIRSWKTETDAEDRFRSVPLTRGVAECLQMRIAQGHGDWIFGRRVNRNYFYKKLKTNIRRLVRAGLLDKEKFLDETRIDPNLHAGPCVRFTVHDLRHTFASHFLKKGGDIKTLQYILGHRRLATTERYLHLVNSRALTSPIDY